MSAAQKPPDEPFEPTSTKPYFIRALHEWCGDNGLTPYLTVAVDPQTRVPQEFVKDGEIVLNVSTGATDKLRIGNDWIEFSARFGGRVRELSIPLARVSAIYSKETGHGMGFEVAAQDGQQHASTPNVQSLRPSLAVAGTESESMNEATDKKPTSLSEVPKKAAPARPKLTVVK